MASVANHSRLFLSSLSGMVAHMDVPSLSERAGICSHAARADTREPCAAVGYQGPAAKAERDCAAKCTSV